MNPNAASAPAASATPPALAEVQAALGQIDASAAFRPSRRHRQLLRHLVERSLAGEQAALKESVIAVEVFGRPASRFDPRHDTIVRVETRRLRQRLAAYYLAEGQQAALRIALPIGSYVPHIGPRGDDQAQRAATRRARDLVERGDAFLRLPLSQASLEQALARFDAALRESPEHVPALVGMGRAWFNLASARYHPPAPAAEHAAEALRRAQALAPAQAESLALLGALVHSFERDWPAALKAFQQAVALAPNMAFVHSAFGRHLLARGLLGQADHHLHLARVLDAQYVNARLHMVNLRIAQGRWADAQHELDGLQDLAPGSMPALGLAALLAMERGQWPAAVQLLRRASQAAPDHADAQAAVAAALGGGGQIAQADALIAALHAGDGSTLVSHYMQAVVAARCGRPEAALAQLGQCLDAAEPNAIWLDRDPSFARLHGLAGWPLLVARMRRRRTAAQ